MKKYFLLALLTIFMLSCSKKEVVITGKLANASPLERIELIEASAIATLPVANIGLDEKGNFSDTLTIANDGIYALAYGGKVNFIYLKKGKNINISGDGNTLQNELKITGDGQANNEFLMDSQKFIIQYLSKLDMTVLTKDEASFLKELEKYRTDITKKIDEIATAKKPDSDVIDWKKGDLDVNLLMLSVQYESMHGQATNNPNFKVSPKFKEFQKKLEKEDFVKKYPTYRQYLLSKLGADLQKFAQTQKDTNATNTQVFLNFLDTQKDLAQDTKDYLAAFVATQFDLNPQNDKLDQVMKVLNEKIKSTSVKADLAKVQEAMVGIKVGTPVPDVELIKQDGKTTKLSEMKGKPTLLVFYSSWAPGMVERITPVLKELTDFYKSKMNFALINMDDNAKQFGKTSKALMNGITGTNLYAKGGLKSDAAQKFAIYGFKLPSFMVIDKDGKVASKVFFNIADTQFIEILNKQTGLTAPTAPPAQMPQGTAPAPTPEAKGHEGHGHK
ncbi:MAG: TlpA family protein disulfide reductase [Cloacibacterium sp.]|jgi:peroxiredoxin|nr:TlpA family protein disulfide reductase [Cloacibacterium sp.]